MLEFLFSVFLKSLTVAYGTVAGLSHVTSKEMGTLMVPVALAHFCSLFCSPLSIRQYPSNAFPLVTQKNR
jgi:hypothetical protein